MEIKAGELVVFVGPSGCGKSTTLKMINRLIEPTGGRIRIDGEDVTDIDPVKLRRKVGYYDPVERALPAHDRRPEHRAGPEDDRLVQVPDQGPGGGDARPGRARRR